MNFDDLQKSIKQRKQRNIQASVDVFDEAFALAYANGFVLERKRGCYHYQLTWFGGEEDEEYIYNLYPTTQRIYADPHHRGPFLNLKKPWTVLDVVKAAVKLLGT